MPRQEIKYICDVCNAKYMDRKVAVDCEKSHYTPKEISKVNFDTSDRKNEFPSSITVVLENQKGETKTITYKRS